MKVTFRRIAAAELREAVAWYQLRQTGLGLDLRDEVDRVIQGIVEHPDRWAIYHKEIRRAVVRRFPYLLYYDIRLGEIRVFRIVHTSRDPLPVKDLLP